MSKLGFEEKGLVRASAQCTIDWMGACGDVVAPVSTTNFGLPCSLHPQIYLGLVTSYTKKDGNVVELTTPERSYLLNFERTEDKIMVCEYVQQIIDQRSSTAYVTSLEASVRSSSLQAPSQRPTPQRLAFNINVGTAGEGG